MVASQLQWNNRGRGVGGWVGTGQERGGGGGGGGGGMGRGTQQVAGMPESTDDVRWGGRGPCVRAPAPLSPPPCIHRPGVQLGRGSNEVTRLPCPLLIDGNGLGVGHDWPPHVVLRPERSRKQIRIDERNVCTRESNGGSTTTPLPCATRVTIICRSLPTRPAHAHKQ